MDESRAHRFYRGENTWEKTKVGKATRKEGTKRPMRSLWETVVAARWFIKLTSSLHIQTIS